MIGFSCFHPKIILPFDRSGGGLVPRGARRCRHLPAEPSGSGAESVDDVTRLLSNLVAIPSVNPMGRSLGGPGFLEGGMSDYLERWFRELGVPYERTVVSPGRDNLVARYEAPGGRTTLLF